jgi:hypothetical protein
MSAQRSDRYGVLAGIYFCGDELEIKSCKFEGCVVPTQAAGNASIPVVNPSKPTCMHKACVGLFLIATHEILCSIRCLITADGCNITSEQAIKMV